MNPIICTTCLGKGLISTGSNPQNLDEGSKVTCSLCKGTGTLSNSDVATEVPSFSAVVDVDPVDLPKEPDSSPAPTGEESTEPSLIIPSVGD